LIAEADMPALRATLFPVALLFGFQSCPKPDTGDTNSTGGATWQLTCGDPVCSGHSEHGVAACTSETAGAACPNQGDTCDPGNGCNSDLVCAVEDPAVNCPISLRSAKTEIHYLAPDEVAAVANDLRDVRLATWRYTDEPAGSKPHLGFIIDDLPPGTPAVRADGGHVDLYGWASMNAAAVQDQERRIAELERELAELKAELAKR
jgi:hypothetical protein